MEEICGKKQIPVPGCYCYFRSDCSRGITYYSRNHARYWNAQYGSPKAIIRRMKAVENLGSTTVICTDKTGTLTKNQMTVRQLMLPKQTYGITGEGFMPEGTLTLNDTELTDEEMSEMQRGLDSDLQRLVYPCHNSQIAEIDGQWTAIGDPTDSACAVLGYKINGSVSKFAQRHPRKHEFFFNTDRKRMSVIHEYEGKIGYLLRVSWWFQKLVNGK